MANVKLSDVLIRPVMTEKSELIRSMKGVDESKRKDVIIFEVNIHATKTLIKAAMAKLFQVTTVRINTKITGGKIHDLGKLRRKGGVGLKKVAFIYPKAGQSLNTGVI